MTASPVLAQGNTKIKLKTKQKKKESTLTGFECSPTNLAEMVLPKVKL